jgi:hypothetical protein
MTHTSNTPNLDTPWLEPRADGKGSSSGINRIWWRWLIDVLEDLDAALPETILTARGQIIRMGATEPEALAAQAANTFLGGDGTDVTVRTAAQALASLGYEVGTWTPTLSSFTGTITTVGAVSGFYLKWGRLVAAWSSLAITTNGTGATLILSDVPFAADTEAIGNGREDNVTGNQLQGQVVGTTVFIRTYNNAYPGGDGRRLAMTYVYRTAS